MQSKTRTVDEYLQTLTEDRKAAVSSLRNTILKNLPEGFEEMMNYGMIGYIVPQVLYPKGYHTEPKQPLPFINLASQKKLYCTLSYGHLLG